MKMLKKALLVGCGSLILLTLLIGLKLPDLVRARVGNDSEYKYVIKDMDKMVVVTVPPKSVARAMVYRGSVENLLAERRSGTGKVIARVVVADWWPLSWHY